MSLNTEGGPLDVCAKVKVPARRRRSKTEKRRIQTSLGLCVHQDTPAMLEVQQVSRKGGL